MRKAQEGDIIRIKGGDRYGIYEVVSTSRSPRGPVYARGADGPNQIAHDDIIIVTRRGNRYDYSINGEVIE